MEGLALKLLPGIWVVAVAREPGLGLQHLPFTDSGAPGRPPDPQQGWAAEVQGGLQKCFCWAAGNCGEVKDGSGDKQLMII